MGAPGTGLGAPGPGLRRHWPGTTIHNSERTVRRTAKDQQIFRYRATESCVETKRQRARNRVQNGDLPNLLVPGNR